MGSRQKKRFFLNVFPNVGGWGSWFPNKVQTPQTHPPKSPRKSPFLTQISPFVFPNLEKKTWGEWVGKQIWERYPKKNVFFFGSFPYPGFVFFYTSFIIYISSSIPRHGLGGEGPYPNPTKPYLDLGYQEYLEYLEYLETGHFSKLC